MQEEEHNVVHMKKGHQLEWLQQRMDWRLEEQHDTSTKLEPLELQQGHTHETELCS